MTDDLLERLRQYSKPGRGDDHPVAVACREAKDRIEALTVELDRARDKYEAKDGMDGAVVYAIRRLLNEANVPLAAFIDDHVLNAIIQRNVAEADNARLLKALTFYADEENYKGYTHTDPCGCCSSWYEPKIHIDGEDSGNIARAAIAALNPEEETK
jgi:hypothetical protein